MLVPLSLLWNLRIGLRQKLGLAGIFSLTVVIMIQSIIRVAVLGSGSQFDLTWSWTWGTIELTVGESPLAPLIRYLLTMKSSQLSLWHAWLHFVHFSVTNRNPVRLNMTRKLPASGHCAAGRATLIGHSRIALTALPSSTLTMGSIGEAWRRITFYCPTEYTSGIRSV